MLVVGSPVHQFKRNMMRKMVPIPTIIDRYCNPGHVMALEIRPSTCKAFYRYKRSRLTSGTGTGRKQLFIGDERAPRHGGG